MSIYIYVCWVYLVTKSYKLLISCYIYKVMFVRLLKLLKLRCLFTYVCYIFCGGTFQVIVNFQYIS